MPSYKTHSIHGEVVLEKIDTKIEIQKDEIKTFCIGPDSLIATGHKVFKKQHISNVKNYFETLLKQIKKNKLHDNSEVMAFLYGQLDHYILDVVMHPYINYFSNKKEKDSILSSHTLTEMWIDDYIINKYSRNEKRYYRKTKISDKGLKKLIDYIYKEIYKSSCVSLKYKYGINLISKFDYLIRRNSILIASCIAKSLNIGDIFYHEDQEHITPYLNLNNDMWYNPETGEEYTSSFDNLWDESINKSIEIIDEANKFLYDDKQFSNTYIINNISYDTGISCETEKDLKYVMRYNKKM